MINSTRDERKVKSIKIKKRGGSPMNTEKEEKKEQKKEKGKLEEKKVVKNAKNKEKPLKPVVLVVIPESVMEKQTKDVQDLLKQLNALKERTSPDGAKIRRALRKARFKLSDFRKRSPEVKK